MEKIKIIGLLVTLNGVLFGLLIKSFYNRIDRIKKEVDKIWSKLSNTREQLKTLQGQHDLLCCKDDHDKGFTE